MKIGNVELNNRIILAPLAGYTNSSYRGIAKEMGASLVYSEMVSAKGLIFENDKTFEYIVSKKEERPIAIQLFGGEISDLIKATKIVTESGYADIIDINMGCPVKKVIKQGAGAYLLKDPQKVYEMVKGVVENTTLPVTVKIRAGWDHDSINCIEIAKMMGLSGESLVRSTLKAYENSTGCRAQKMMGRFAFTSDSLSYEQNAKEVERAIDDILEHDFVGIFKKVVRDESSK